MGYLNCEHSQAVKDVAAELDKARSKFADFNSSHEGWAVIYEEVDELWREVQSKGRTRESMRGEAVQIAAMAIRFIEDVCDRDTRPVRAAKAVSAALRHVSEVNEPAASALVDALAILGGPRAKTDG